MKVTIRKKIKEVCVLLITVVMVLSTVAVTADTNDNRAVSLTSCTKGSNHMFFSGEETHGNGILLWDNGDPDGRDGVSCCYWPGTLDREIVDDFDIDDTSWTVDGGHFRMVTWAGQNAEFIDGVNVFLYEDTGNKPSVTRYAERVAEFEAYNTGDYYFQRPEIAIDVTFDTVDMDAGKWWVCFQPVLEGNGFWLTSAGYGNTVWCSMPGLGYPKWTSGYIIWGEGYDMSFKLFRSNLPPETPSIPDGPDEGLTGVEYTFTTTSTIDPEGDPVCYMFDWGDGTYSKWLGPYESGATCEASHSWDDAEEYEIRVQAKDNYGESDWSDPHIITIFAGPKLEIDTIKGGLFKVSATIKNTGLANATNVNWSIKLDGGAFIGKETEGTDLTISAGGNETVTSKFILGFGPTKVIVTAGISGGSLDMKEQNGFVLLFFIKV